MRRLAESFAAADPSVACVHGIDAGDAFALATRFDREWAYGSGNALFWTRAIHAHAIHDRRDVLHVEAAAGGTPLALFGAMLGSDRSARIRSLRLTRSLLRRANGTTIAFVGNAAPSPIGFGDLGFDVAAGDDYNLIVVRPSHATPPPQTAGSQAASASIVRI